MKNTGQRNREGPIANLDEAVTRIRELEPQIRSLGVARLAVFGSILKGAARPDSDVDVLVEFLPGKKTFDRFMDLSELLEEQFGRRVELVTPEALTLSIGKRILAEARDVLRAA